MTLFGVDLSSNDAGLSLASCRRTGFRFATARILSYPKGIMTLDPSWFTFRDQAKQLGMLFRGYVLFHTYYSPAEQASHAAAAVEDLTIPVMIDLEPDSDSPSLVFAAACWDALKTEGLRPVALYDPRWYWSALGGPDLTIRPWSLVSSNYGSDAPGAAVTRYQAEGGDTGPGWAPYGGLTPAEWQFGSQIVLGTEANGSTRYGDADAYRGDLATLGASGLFTDWSGDTMTAPKDWDAADDLHVRTEVAAAGQSTGDDLITSARNAARDAAAALTALAALSAKVDKIIAGQGPAAYKGDVSITLTPGS